MFIKSDWGDGPWIDESDYKRWIDPITGYLCMIKRGPLGALNGYVGVSRDHKFYKIKLESELDVHGGITFQGFFDDDQDTWWFGFDCAHGGDIIPELEYVRRNLKLPVLRFIKETYKDINYVEIECELLAEQLKVKSENNI